MFTMLQVGAILLACAYLLLMWWPRRGRWAGQLPLGWWTVAFGGSIMFALAFLGVGLGASSNVLTLSGIVMGAAAVLAHDGYWAAESYQRRWGEC
jgi:drug/metabolite transporter (DMT)-like permease